MRQTKKADQSVRRAEASSTRRVPLIIPHGAAGAGRDFESAFDLLQCDHAIHKLWNGARPEKSCRRAGTDQSK
jgi:hypothetical protein